MMQVVILGEFLGSCKNLVNVTMVHVFIRLHGGPLDREQQATICPLGHCLVAPGLN